DYSDIYTEGITKITETDIKYAKALEGSIKLLGTSKIEDKKVYSMVAPFIIGKEHPLANVNGVFNGIFINGNMLGDTMFYGRGAGKLPTASAVVSDIVDEVKHRGNNIMTIWDEDKIVLEDKKSSSCRFFVRVDNSKEEVERVFDSVKYVSAEGIDNETAFLTEVITEGEFDEKIAGLNCISRIRTAL
ncbi:MAG: homoserine dehydrogenase, partial [Wujia sp.]